MLVILVGTLFVTLVCYYWGYTIYKGIITLSCNGRTDEPHMAIICLLGLSTLIVFAGLFSFFFPLKSWLLRAMVFLPPLFLLTKGHFLSEKILIKKYHTIPLLLTVVLLLLTLSMASWEITHPDTLDYHFQNIQWIREYKIIPGLAHLNFRYGLQGLWFPVCALFDFVIWKVNLINLLNVTVVFWFIYFVIWRFCRSLKDNKAEGLLWMALLSISLWNYTQVRLTITSASPDFIVSIFLYAAIYLMLKRFNLISISLAIIFFLTSVAIKLSAVPIIPAVVYCFYLILKEKKTKILVFLLLFGCVISSCFIVRNSVTTGYLLFPSSFPDLIDPDWKMEISKVQKQQLYVTAYARTRTGGYGDATLENVMNYKPSQWILIWWRHLSWSDRAIALLLVFTLISLPLMFRRVIRCNSRTKFMLATLLGTITFWFYFAPDIRFGSGFIIPFIGIISYIALAPIILISRKVLITAATSVLLFTSTYTIYRLSRFFSRQQMLLPLEISSLVPRRIICNDLEIIVTENYKPDQVPERRCKNFTTRGSNITDGFKASDAD